MRTLSRSRLVLPTILCLVFVCSCERFKKVTPESEKKRVEKEIGYGKLDGNVYTNAYFNLKVSVPEGWHISSKAEKKELEEVSKDYSTRNLDTPQMKVARARVVNMLSAFRFKPDVENLGKPNYNLTMFAENIRLQRFIIKTGEHYLKAMKQQLNATTLKYSFQKIQSGFKIGSIPAYRMKAQMSVNGVDVDQIFYCAIAKDYALVASFTYTKPEQLKELEALFNSIEASY